MIKEIVNPHYLSEKKYTGSLKHYAFSIEEKGHDRSGNPQSIIHVYRIKKNVPILLRSEIREYRDNIQAACDIIADAENWGKTRYRIWFCPNYPNGFSENGVHRAKRHGKIKIHYL